MASFSHTTTMKTYADSNECYTKENTIYPLIKYLDKSKTIWCPCDLESSNYVKVFKREGFNVIYSHISLGQDFYTYEPSENFDIIITNPPFEKKANFMKRVLSFNKPFAILLPLTWLNDSAPFNLFKDFDIELLIFNKRPTFLNQNFKTPNPTFSCGYYCKDILPKQIVFDSLESKGLFN